MRPRHALPTLWLMTDPRQGERLWQALERLPRGAGVVFRHYGVAGRRGLFDRVRAVARRRGLLLLLAGSPREAAAWRADGVHGAAPYRVRSAKRLRTVSAHDVAELRRAERLGADLAFLSPLHATRSHPQARGLGRARFGLALRQARLPVVALGGMSPRRGRAARAMGAVGWAAIDALTREARDG